MPLVALTQASLPAVSTLYDCANFTITVTPFLPQLQTLPTQVFQHLLSFDGLKNIYVSTNPLITSVAFSLLLSAIVLVVSEINRNYSQVDRLWSMLPTLYNAHYTLWAHMNGLPTQRLDNILACSAVWSMRLTFNYWRKGGYNIGSEDYRWAVLQTKMHPVLFFNFNVFFISLYQNLLLCFITAPTYVLLISSLLSQPQMTIVDVVFARLIMGIIMFEYFADQQQWNFHQAKESYLKTAKVPTGYSQASLDRGFVTSGFWAYSRHPNFVAEQSVWVVLYLWSCSGTGKLYNWAGIGAINYLALFQASTAFTEAISGKKYPDYKEYKMRVGKFFPKLFGSGIADWNTVDEKKVQ